jgi:hypothetical protein
MSVIVLPAPWAVPRAILLDHLAAALPTLPEPEGAGGYGSDGHRVVLQLRALGRSLVVAGKSSLHPSHLTNSRQARLAIS